MQSSYVYACLYECDTCIIIIILLLLPTCSNQGFYISKLLATKVWVTNHRLHGNKDLQSIEVVNDPDSSWPMALRARRRC